MPDNNPTIPSGSEYRAILQSVMADEVREVAEQQWKQSTPCCDTLEGLPADVKKDIEKFTRVIWLDGFYSALKYISGKESHDATR